MTGTGEEIFSRHKSVEFDINPNKSIPKKTGLYALFKKSELGGIRTLDQLIKSQLLYQLSYEPLPSYVTILKKFFQVFYKNSC